MKPSQEIFEVKYHLIYNQFATIASKEAKKANPNIVTKSVTAIFHLCHQLFAFCFIFHFQLIYILYSLLVAKSRYFLCLA